MEEREGQTWTKETGVANKVEKEKPSKQNLKSSLRSLLRFFRGCFLFHFIAHLSFPLFRFDLPSLPCFFLSLFIVHPFLPSLPWFFLSLFIVQAFLLWSPALAVQALPLAHHVEWCLRASTASPSLHPQSGAQVGFLKMSAEGLGSRVIRANNFGLRPSLLSTGLGSRKEDGFSMKSRICFHNIRREIGFLSQNTKSSLNNIYKPGN